MGEGMLHIDLIAVNCSSRSPWIVGKTQNDVTWKSKQQARGTIWKPGTDFAKLSFIFLALVICITLARKIENWLAKKRKKCLVTFYEHKRRSSRILILTDKRFLNNVRWILQFCHAFWVSDIIVCWQAHTLYTEFYPSRNERFFKASWRTHR